MSVLVGEVAHQLRSAVDHIAYGLVLSSGGSRTRRTSFPVCTSRPDGPLQIDGHVAPAALSAVEQVQPYQLARPEAHPLHVLNELWNVDKHRTLHLTTLRLRDSQIFMAAPDGRALVGGHLQTGPLRDGSIVGAFSFSECTTSQQ